MAELDQLKLEIACSWTYSIWT